MKVDLFNSIRKLLDYPESTQDECIEVEIRKDWFERKGFKDFKLNIINPIDNPSNINNKQEKQYDIS